MGIIPLASQIVWNAYIWFRNFELEIKGYLGISRQGKTVFVDTNIILKYGFQLANL